jgi:hypothetical protein
MIRTSWAGLQCDFKWSREWRIWRKECLINDSVRKGHALQQVWWSKQDVKLISSLHTANVVETLKKNWSVKGGARSWMLFFFPRHSSPYSDRASSLSRLHVTLRHSIFGRTPLEEASARRRFLYLTTHNIHKRRHSCPRQNSNPQSQQASGRDLNLRPRGHRDRQLIYCNKLIWRLDRANQMVPHHPGCRKSVKWSNLSA